MVRPLQFAGIKVAGFAKVSVLCQAGEERLGSCVTVGSGPGGSGSFRLRVLGGGHETVLKQLTETMLEVEKAKAEVEDLRNLEERTVCGLHAIVLAPPGPKLPLDPP